MQLKVALHAHTRRSDGMLSPNDVLRIHREQGFDVLAITDHDFDLTEEQISQLEVPAGLTVLRGSEVSFRELYWQHVNHIYGETKTLRVLNHPARYGMNVKQIEDAIRKFEFDAFEITNQGVYCPQYESIRFPRVATDDSHNEGMIGRSFMLVDASDRSTDAIIDAVIEQRIEIKTDQRTANSRP